MKHLAPSATSVIVVAPNCNDKIAAELGTIVMKYVMTRRQAGSGGLS